MIYKAVYRIICENNYGLGDLYWIVYMAVIPFSAKLQQLQYGDMLFVQGFVPAKSQSFAINLQMNLGNGKADTILHVNPRPPQKVIVRNTLIFGEKWGSEERHHGLGAIKTNQNFECCILVQQDCYKIAFNRTHFADYRHRAAPASVNQVHVTGSVEVTSLWIQPAPAEGQVTLQRRMPALHRVLTDIRKNVESQRNSKSNLPHVLDKPFGYKLEVPFLHTVPQGLTPGTALYFTGKPAKLSSGFFVNFKVGGALGSRDIAFHLRVYVVKKCVVCNTFSRGRWGKEQTENVVNFPFKRGVTFDMLILAEYGKFKVLAAVTAVP